MDKYKIIAHRGASGLFGDNNYQSIQKAIEMNIKIIEIDVRLTQDNKLVLNHDSIVNVNNENYIIEKSKYIDINDKIILLEDVIHSSPMDVIYYLDIKICEHNVRINYINDFYNQFNIFLKKYTNRNFIIASFNIDFIKYFPKYSNIELGFICEKFNKKELDKIINIIEYYIIDINDMKNINKKDLVFIQNKLKLFAYTINDKNISKPYEKILNGIITDFPNLFI